MQQSTDGDGEQNLKLEEDNHVVSNESQLHAKGTGRTTNGEAMHDDKDG